MKSQIVCDEKEFRFDQGIIIWKVKMTDWDIPLENYPIDNWLDAIYVISQGEYFPLIIDLRSVDKKYVARTIQLLATNQKIRSLIIAKSFLVDSVISQFVLIAFKGIYDPILPNMIFRNYNSAILYCRKIIRTYNGQN